MSSSFSFALTTSIHPALWLSYHDIPSWKGITQECKTNLLVHAHSASQNVDTSNMAIFISNQEPTYIVIQSGSRFMQKKVVLLKNTRETHTYSTDPAAYISDVLCNQDNRSYLKQIPIHDFKISRINAHYSHFLDALGGIIKNTSFEAHPLNKIQLNTFHKVIDRFGLTKSKPKPDYSMTLLTDTQNTDVMFLHLNYQCYPAKVTCNTLIAVVLPKNFHKEIQDDSDVIQTVFRSPPYLFQVFPGNYNLKSYFDDAVYIHKAIP